MTDTPRPDACRFVYRTEDGDYLCGAIESIHGEGLGRIGDHAYVATTPRPDDLWAVDFDRLTRDHAEVIAHPSHEHGQCRTCMQPYPCTIARLLAVRADTEREVARLREALEELDRTYRAHLDAWNGRGHPGEAHDRDLHKYHSHGESPEESGCSLTRDDCAGCAGAMYGSDVEHGDAHCAARAALATLEDR